MTDHRRPPPARRTPRILGHRRLPPVAGRPQRRDRRRDRLQRRVDPAALRHQAAPLGRARGDRADDVGRGRRARRSSAPASTPARSTASSSPPSPTCSRPRPSPPRSPTSSAPTRPAAFDISAACAGFCHGLALASDMVRGGSAGYVLVIGVERLSDITDLDDRGTAFIFADGAGAAVVGPSDTPGIGPVVWGSDGEQFDLIRQREDWRDVDRRRRRPAMPHLVMQGNPVFRWASFAMAKIGQQALDRAGVTARRPRRLRAAPGQHAHHRRDGALDEAARARSRSPATSPSRATPRPPRSRSPSTG